MAIPSYQAMMLSMLRSIGEGKERIEDCQPDLIRQFGLTSENVEMLLPSGKQTVLSNRAHWARNYLSQAGLVEAHARGRYHLTEAGRALLASNPSAVTNDTLKQYPAFLAFLERSKPKADGASSVVEPAPQAAQTTPEEAMKSAHDLLDATLRDDLLAQLADLHPIRFERLILDLLSAMGFGGGDLSRTQMTKASGDGGIDGIIHEDALGLDRVYIQAKRYAPGNNVGSPAIYQFVGSLTAQGAAKGVFVTTSDFSKEARGVAAGITHHRIVLIDGQDLARLMIRYGVGVRPRTTFVVHGIDEDYFKPADG